MLNGSGGRCWGCLYNARVVTGQHIHQHEVGRGVGAENLKPSCGGLVLGLLCQTVVEGGAAVACTMQWQLWSSTFTIARQGVGLGPKTQN
jgi:hypothetical protein